MALAAGRFDRPWLFSAGIGLLLVALALPARRGETVRDKLSAIARHLPGVGWLRHERPEEEEEEEEEEEGPSAG